MEKQLDWKNPDDYAYLKTLDKKGLAWEFIRRSPSYRKAYNSFKPLQDQFGNKWHKQQTYDISVPKKLPDEKKRSWEERACDMGIKAEILSLSQECARQWQLFDMYDPHIKYSAEEIRFSLSRKPPLFYAEPSAWPSYEGVTIENFMDERACDKKLNKKQRAEMPKEKVKLLKTEKKCLDNIRALAKLQRLESLQEAPSDHSLIVVFDLRLPMKEQLTYAGPIFQALATKQKEESNKNKNQKRMFETYIRFLDALLTERTSTEGKIYQTITGKKYNNPESLTRATNIVKSAAFDFAENRYKAFLFDI